MTFNRTLSSFTAMAVCVMAPAHAQGEFDLPTLIESARQEATITVYAPTGKIVQQAEDFTEKYGVSAVGVKAKAAQTIAIVSRGAR